MNQFRNAQRISFLRRTNRLVEGYVLSAIYQNQTWCLSVFFVDTQKVDVLVFHDYQVNKTIFIEEEA